MYENYKNESLVDVAFSVLKERTEPITFKELYDEVCAKKELNEGQKSEEISRFFTNLSLDGRFVALKNNTWDLRERQKYENIHVDLKDYYDDIESESSHDEQTDEDSDDDALHAGDSLEDDEDEEQEEYREENY